MKAADRRKTTFPGDDEIKANIVEVSGSGIGDGGKSDFDGIKDRPGGGNLRGEGVGAKKGADLGGVKNRWSGRKRGTREPRNSI